MAAVRGGPATVAGPPVASDRATKRGVGLLVAFLVFPIPFSAIEWVADGVPGWRLGSLIVLKALVVTPQLVHSLPSLHRVRDRYWRWTFAAQALLTFGPHFVFGSQWAAGGLLAGSALLLLSARTSWIVLGLVLVAEGALQLAYGGELSWIVFSLVDGTLVIALATYVLTRLVDVLGELRDTRAATAEAVTRQERLRAAHMVFRRLGPRLSVIASAAERARRLAGSNAATAGASAAHLARLARQALTEVRDAARAFRDAGPTAAARAPAPTAEASTESRLAFAVIVVMSLTGAIANLVGILTHQHPAMRTTVVAVAGLAALVALQIYHAAPRAMGCTPRGWWWTLPTQFVLVYLPIPVFGLDWIGMSVYLAACVLVVVRPPASWLVFIVVIASLPAILAVLPDRPWFFPYPVPTRVVVLLVAAVWTLLIFFSPMLAATSVVQLRTARAELIRMTLVRERLGVARDVHDLLGSSLSAVALKADLAQRLLPRDAYRAERELTDAADLARRAITEARALSGELPDTSLAQELAAARSMLATANIQAVIAPCPGGLPAQTDTALAIVVREAVTNLLRHSAAQHCTISFMVDDETVRLSVTNDGATSLGTGSGTGIANLSARVLALGGRLRAAPKGEQEFSLHAEVPSPASPNSVGSTPRPTGIDLAWGA